MPEGMQERQEDCLYLHFVNHLRMNVSAAHKGFIKLIKLNLKNGVAIFIAMGSLSFVGFYFFKILAFAAQGGSGYGVKFFFWFLLFFIEFIGISGLLALISGMLNDFYGKPKINWNKFTVFSILLAVIAFLITKGPIGL